MHAQGMQRKHPWISLDILGHMSGGCSLTIGSSRRGRNSPRAKCFVAAKANVRHESQGHARGEGLCLRPTATLGSFCKGLDLGHAASQWGNGYAFHHKTLPLKWLKQIRTCHTVLMAMRTAIDRRLARRAALHEHQHASSAGIIMARNFWNATRLAGLLLTRRSRQQPLLCCSPSHPRTEAS